MTRQSTAFDLPTVLIQAFKNDLGPRQLKTLSTDHQRQCVVILANAAAAIAVVLDQSEQHHRRDVKDSKQQQ